MEEFDKFYLQVVAHLKTLQTNKLSQERLLPVEIAVCENKKETVKSRKLSKKKEKQRLKIEQGYFKGVNDSLRILEKVYRLVLKNVDKD